jgi:outer membrane receptor protein involved in Fe transport
MNIFCRTFWIVLLGVQAVLCVYGTEDGEGGAIVSDVSEEMKENACEGRCEEVCDEMVECGEGEVDLPAEPYGEFCGRPVYIISASGCWDKDLLDVPQTVNIMSYDDLNEATVYKDLQHALEEIPNVNLGPVAYKTAFGKTSSNWDQGFTIRGLGLQRVITVIDGVRQAAQGIGHGGSHLSLFDPYTIEKVEVIKGPSSVAYGCDAIGGVVSIITREPKERCESGVDGGVLYQMDTAENFWRDSAYVDVGNEYYGLIVGGTYGEYDIPRLPHGEKAPGGSMQKYGGWFKLNYYLSDCATLTLLGNRLNVRDILLGAGSFDYMGFVFNYKNDIPLYDRSELGVQLEVNDISECVDCSLTAFSWGQTRRKLHRFSQRFKDILSFDIDIIDIDAMTHEAVNTYEFREQLEFDFCPHHLMVGVDLALDVSECKEKEDNMVQKEFVRRVKVDAHQTRVGLYGQDTWELDPCLDMVLGVRYDTYETEDLVRSHKKYEEGVSGSLGFNYKPTECSSCFLNLATGFRSPDLGERYQELFYQNMLQTVVYGNPDLTSERSFSVEGGTKYCNDCFSYQFSVFANRIDDYVSVRTVLPELRGMRRYRYVNVGTVSLYGAEGQCVYRPDECWRLYATAGRTFTSDSGKISLPNWVFNYGVSYEIPVYCGVVETVVPELIMRSALSSFDSLNAAGESAGSVAANLHYAGYTTVNAQLSFNLCSGEYLEGKWIVGVSNLFNKAYRQPFFDQLQPERGFFTSVQIGF